MAQPLAWRSVRAAICSLRASSDFTARLWNTTTGQEVRTLRGHTSWVYSVAFSSDGKLVASCSDDGTVKVWDMASGQELRTLKGHTRAVLTLAFSPDGTALASGSGDRTVKLWDTTTGHELRTIKGHGSQVNNVAFIADGKLLASGSNDNTVRLWDPATGQEVRTLKGHSDSVNSVAFSPDGRMLASASNDKTVKLWDATRERKDIEKRWAVWHSQQVKECEEAEQWFPAAFHLGWLVKVEPNYIEFQKRLRHAQEKLKESQQAAAPPQRPENPWELREPSEMATR